MSREDCRILVAAVLMLAQFVSVGREIGQFVGQRPAKPMLVELGRRTSLVFSDRNVGRVEIYWSCAGIVWSALSPSPHFVKTINLFESIATLRRLLF